MDDEKLISNPQNETEQPNIENNSSESPELDDQNKEEPKEEETRESGQTPAEGEFSEGEKNATPEISAETKPGKFSGWLRKTLIGLIIVILIFAAGFIVSQITYTAPIRSSFQQISAEKDQIQEELTKTQNQLTASQSDLENKTAELTVTQSDLRTAESTIEQLKTVEIFNRNLEEMKYHVALARIALLKEDKLSARQALNLAQDNLDKLTPLLDTDNLQAVKQRLADAYSLSISDFDKALEELRTLTENLERIPIK